MDASIVTAVAGLTGALIGGLTSVLASWLSQHTQAKAQRLQQDQLQRQGIYKEFINDAAKLYVDALQSDKADVSALMALYAQVSKMRVLSSASVIDRADEMLKKITNTYLEPNKALPELSEMANSGLIDPLRNFSEACRANPSVSISGRLASYSRDARFENIGQVSSGASSRQRNDDSFLLRTLLKRGRFPLS